MQGIISPVEPAFDEVNFEAVCWLCSYCGYDGNEGSVETCINCGEETKPVTPRTPAAPPPRTTKGFEGPKSPKSPKSPPGERTLRARHWSTLTVCVQPSPEASSEASAVTIFLDGQEVLSRVLQGADRLRAGLGRRLVLFGGGQPAELRGGGVRSVRFAELPPHADFSTTDAETAAGAAQALHAASIAASPLARFGANALQAVARGFLVRKRKKKVQEPVLTPSPRGGAKGTQASGLEPVDAAPSTDSSASAGSFAFGQSVAPSVNPFQAASPPLFSFGTAVPKQTAASPQIGFAFGQPHAATKSSPSSTGGFSFGSHSSTQNK